MTTPTVVRERRPTDTGTMHIMNHDGDINVSWDKNDPDDVAMAKGWWDDATKVKKYLGYKVEGEEGRRGEVMREFDPTAERLILSPQAQGG